MRPRQQDLRPPRGLQHLVNVPANGVALTVALASNLFLKRDRRLGAPEVHDDITVTDLLHGPRFYLSNTAAKLAVDPLSLCLTDTLNEDLLRSLNSVTPEIGEVEFLEHHGAYLSFGVQAPGLFYFYLKLGLVYFLHHGLACEHGHAARVSVELYFEVFGIAVALLCGRDQRIRERLNNHLTVNVFLSRNLGKCLNDI